MVIALDHVIVPSRDQRAGAKRLGELLGVPWAETGVGPFSPVYVNDGLTLDFIDHPGTLPVEHYCFRVDDAAFDAIFGRIRAAGIAYRSAPHGPFDMKTGTILGGRMVYWEEPDGHYWEIVTVSYARAPAPGPA